MVESLGDVLPECVACTTRRDAPATPIVWVRPQEVAHWALVRNLLNAVERSDVVQRVDAGGKTTVKTENLVVDEGGQREVVEEVGEVLPDVGVAVLPEALIVEAVNLGNLA